VSGQLGHALKASAPVALGGSPLELILCDRSNLDLADPDACRAVVGHLRPDWILNAGAYTAVDKAESEAEHTFAVNAGAPRAFAEALVDCGGRLLQLSTDFVFGGAQGHPYRPDQSRNPLGVYGASKASGEEAIEELMGTSGEGLILRTSWLMGPVGQNFALTMLRLHNERDELNVVADQVGCPTSTRGLAAACWRLIEIAQGRNSLPLKCHWCDAGAASWYDVAYAIGELGKQLGLIECEAKVQPISTSDYPTPAPRPSYSLLDCRETWHALDLQPLHWRKGLQEILLELKRLRSGKPLI